MPGGAPMVGPPDRLPPTLDLRLGPQRLALRYLADGAEIYVLAAGSAAEWPSAALRQGRVEVVRNGRGERRQVSLVVDAAERARQLERFRSACGEDRFRDWYPRPGRLLRLTPVDGPSTAARAYDAWLRSEFDAAASTYADAVRGNPLEAYQRERSLAYLRRHLGGRRRLLELGCGPGLETLPLLRDGHEIVAVDVSSEMLERLGANARAEGVSERLARVQGRLRDLPSLDLEGTFDGGYSTFGALSCEPDLSPVRDGLGRRFAPRAPFVAGVLNRTPALEGTIYAATARWRRATARLRSPAPVGLTRYSVDCFAYSPAGLARRFAPFFDASDVEGLGIVVPPPDLLGRFAGHWSLDRLGRLDARVGRTAPFRALGDHFLICLRRASAPRTEAA